MRALRAAVFAAVCVTVAALGHSFTSAHRIPFGALSAAFVCTGAAAWLAGGRRHGFASLGPGLLAVQGVLHLVFTGALPYGLSLAPHDRHTVSGPARDTGMDMGMAMGTAANGGLDGDSGMSAAALDGPAAMVAAHLLAAVVCALWLARGEAALFRLARALDALAFTPLRLLLTAPRLPRVPGRVPLTPAAPDPHRFRGVVLTYSLSRRGPPAAPCVRTTAPEATPVRTARPALS